MGQLLVYLIIIGIAIFWIILPIYRKISGTNIDGDLFGDDCDKQQETLAKLTFKTSEKKLLNIFLKEKELLLSITNDLITKTINTDFDFLKSGKPDFYFEEEYRDYTWQIKTKLRLTEY